MGEATNRGRARERCPEEILSDLEADMTKLDSSDLGKNVRRVRVADDTMLCRTDAAARSIGEAFRFSRKVLLVFQSAGAPQSMQSRSSNRFSIISPFSCPFPSLHVPVPFPVTLSLPTLPTPPFFRPPLFFFCHPFPPPPFFQVPPTFLFFSTLSGPPSFLFFPGLPSFFRFFFFFRKTV